MKLNKFSRLTATVLLISSGLSVQAAEVWSESFETDGQGSRYTSSLEFNDSNSDHWGRTDGSNISNTSGAYTNMDGTWFWAAEDTDDNGGNGDKEQTLTIAGIDISTYTNLQFSGLFAAGNEGGPGSGAYDAPDYIKVQYQVDGGGYIDGMCFGYEEDAGHPYNEPIGLDADCDGLSDGVAGRLNTTFSNYGFSIPETGSSLDILISVYMDGASEEIALDHLILTGDGGGADVAPTVTTTMPVNGASGVADNTDITINFSENVDATSNAVTMTCTTSGVVTFSTGLPASDVAQLVLTPTSNLTDSESCDVTVVAAEITDTDGIPDNMTSNFEFSFIVGYPTVEIYEIQGSGLASPYDGQTVSSNGNIVTAVGSAGFFMQTPDARDDVDDLTSNGIYVYTGGAPTVSVGDEVDVTGVIDEYYDFTEFASPGSQIISVVSSGNALPSAVVFNDSYPPTDPSLFPCGTEAMGLECIEGMWFDMSQGFISSPYVSFFGAESDDLWVKAGSNRAFREPGITYPGEVGLPVFDGNPELLEVDVEGLGLTIPAAGYNAGSEISMQGAVAFSFGDYVLWPSELTVTNENSLPGTVPTATSEELTMGSLNLFRLFNDVDDPGPEDDSQVADPLVYAGRLAKFANYIVHDMQSPDIMALQEVENIDVLTDLATEITGQSGPVYTAALVEGNDQGGIDVGYLYKASVVSNVQITQLGAAEINPYDSSLLHDRPPLQLSADIVLDSYVMPIQVLNVHLRSMGGIDDSGDGDRVRNKRLSQAQSLADMIADIQNNNPGDPIYVLGDFNAFQFTDGYVDVMGQITGTAVDADNMLWAPPVYAANPLTNTTQTLAADEQYSYIFGGFAQALDHAVVDDTGLLFFKEMNYVRGQADAPLIFEDNYNSSLRASDHDGFVLYVSPELDVIFKNGFD